MDTPVDGKENEQDSRSTLYVGNLPLVTVDSDLLELFQKVGPLSLLRVVRPTNDQFYFKPTCYAYVKYMSEEDANRAIDLLNFHEIHGMQMHVMPCNKSFSKSREGNVFIKNLPSDIDDKTLYDTFSIFGKITSSKISNSTGKSSKYGYVQYEDKKSAKKAIKMVNGSKISGHVIKVMKYEKRMINPVNSFTNIYLKNFPPTITEEELREILEKYGKIDSLFFPRKDDGTPKGFACCNYKDPDSAKSAVEELHGKKIFDDMPEPFYVQRAQLRNERDIEIRSNLAKLSIEGKTPKRNLYVTMIPGTKGEDDIRKKFSEFGKVISVHVGKDTRSKGDTNYAYVCFSTPEEAQAVVERADGVVMDGSRLIISLFKSKVERSKERESGNMMYNPGMNYYQKLVSGTGSSYNSRKSDFYPLRSYEDLYNMILLMAGNYESSWYKLKAKTKEEFSDRLAKLLLKSSKSEIKSMVEISGVLSDSVAHTLKRLGNESVVDDLGSSNGGDARNVFGGDFGGIKR